MRTVIVLIYAAHFPAVHVDRFARSVTGLVGPAGQCLKMCYTPQELVLCSESHNTDSLSVSKNVLYTPGATAVL